MKYKKISAIAAILLVMANIITPALAVDEPAVASQAEVSETGNASASVQNNEETSKAVVVTATKTKKNIIEVPANVTVVTADEIKKNNYQNVKEVLQSVPGFIVQDLGGENALIGVRVPSQMGAVSQVKVLIDGTAGSLTDVDVNSIEKIEIVRGPSSALYGSNATGGVIHIFLKKGANREKIKINTQIGGFNDQIFNLYAQDSNEKFDYNVSARINYTDGWRANSMVQSNIYTGKLNYYIDDTSSVYLNYGRHVFPVKRSPGGITRAQYDTNPAVTNLPWSNSFSDGNRYGTGYQKNLSDNQNISFDTSYSVSNSTNLAAFATSGAQGFYSVSADNNLDTKLKYSHKNLLLAGSEIVTGIDYTSTQSDSYQRPAPNGVINTASKTSDVIGTISPLGFYIQDEIPLWPKFKATVGGRYDSITFDYNDRLKGITNSKNMSTVTPKGTLSYSMDDNSSIYISYGQAFTPPTATHLFKGGGTSLPNPNLSPELATNYEIGYKAAWDRFNLGISAFSMDISNNIVVVRDPVTLVSQFQNAGLSHYNGVELSSAYTLFPEWVFSAGYTYEDAKFINYKTVTNAGAVVDYSGKIIPNVPAHNAVLGLKYNNGPFTANIQHKINSGFYPGADNALFYGGHALTDLRLSWDKRDYELALTITNIFNTKWVGYESSTGVSETILPGDPIKAMVSFTYKF